MTSFHSRHLPPHMNITMTTASTGARGQHETRVYSDVPDALIDLLRRINYHALNPDEQRAALQELERYLCRVRQVRLRSASSPTEMKTCDLTGVPRIVIDMMNRYDYTRVTCALIAIALPIVETALRAKKLLT